MKAYSASPSTCKEYWGHLGRAWNTRYRCTPTIFLLFVLGFALFFLLKGFICVYKYPSTLDKNGPRVTIPEMQRFIRMRKLQGAFLISAFPLILFMPFYTLGGVMSILHSWGPSLKKLRKKAH
jgi:hypothetical protein